MHPDDPLRMCRVGGDVGDRQRGGVGGKDHLVSDHTFDFGQDALFEGEVLEHGLDDQVDVAEPGPIRAARHQLHRPVGGALRHPPPFDLIPEMPGDVAEAVADPGIVDLLDAAGYPGAGAVDRGDAAAHVAAPEDADLANRSRRHVAGNSGVLPQLLAGEEDAHQRLRLR